MWHGVYHSHACAEGEQCEEVLRLVRYKQIGPRHMAAIICLRRVPGAQELTSTSGFTWLMFSGILPLEDLILSIFWTLCLRGSLAPSARTLPARAFWRSGGSCVTFHGAQSASLGPYFRGWFAALGMGLHLDLRSVVVRDVKTVSSYLASI